MRSFPSHRLAASRALAAAGLALVLAAPGAHAAAVPRPTTATAQALAPPGATPRVISFGDAVAIALERNATLRFAEHASLGEDIAVRRAQLEFLPRVSASARSQRGNTDEVTSADVSADVTLFDGLGNIASLREARRQQEASRADVEQSRRTVVVTVVSNYLVLILQEEQLRVQRENLAAADSLERQIAEYVRAGTRTVADLYQQQANTANARLAVVEAERSVHLAQTDLMQTLQLEAGEVVEFEPPALSRMDSGLLPALDSLLQVAYAQRADLSAEQSRAAAAEQSVKVAGSGVWPSLSLTAGYGSSYSSGASGDFSEQFQERRSGSVGLGLSVPIFDRGSNHANIELARLQVANSKLTVDTQRQTVGFEVQRAWLRLRAAVLQRDAAVAQDRAADRSLATTQERYRAGAATFVELAQARAAYVEGASALVTARYNLVFQRALLDYAVGEADPAESLR